MAGPTHHREPEDAVLFAPVLGTTRRFWLGAAPLLAMTLWGMYAYTLQLRYGLGVTGLNRPVAWGIYIINFVFFIGISHAGTLISAILRLCKAEWRRPITRAAEAITVLVLFFGLGSIIMDLGRPDRLLYVLQYGRLQSPLLWDVTSITTYLTGSTLYLYLPLIPDLALVRDRATGWRRTFYTFLALGWRGTPGQHRRLQRGIAVMAVLVIPIAVSVHTVVSWVFSMTLQPMWKSTIFGPYFVTGAIFSGIAALIISMAAVRRAYRLENYLKPVHFNSLALLLLTMSLLWFYFTFAEHLTAYYGGELGEAMVLFAKVTGRYAPAFWAMAVLNFVIPVTILANGRTRTVAGSVVASASVVVGMWLERYLIVVPTLANPRLPYERGFYAPTWVELSITAGAVSFFMLLYMVFTRLFPIISIWEVREGREGLVEAQERMVGYLPGPVEPAVPAARR
ncbi:MAG: polysulfide reductase NrfD [candidate division NC10 bacterium]|nr:polysulfide reductase NrfD [candidate division NC10 bacterium]